MLSTLHRISRRRSGALICLLGFFLVALAGCGEAAARADSQPDGETASVATAVDGAPLGTLGLRVVCSDDARDHVLRGLALLHHMTYEEAAAEFRQATTQDPECAVGYWGVAMTYVHPLWPDVVSDERITLGGEMLARARDASARTDVDDGFIAALAAYYEDAMSRTEPQRLASFAEGWKQAHTANPDDRETTAFYALALLASAPPGDKEYSAQRQAGELVAGVLEAIPDHPGAHHYTIHAYDFPPLADRALEAARRYGRVAPENAHALHMTSHIFTRLGLWRESIEFNRRSADAAKAHPIGGAVSHHHLHALDYLAYAWLQVGDDAEANTVSDHIAALQPPMYDHAATAYAVAAVPVRIALERRHWDEAARLSVQLTDAVPWERYPYLEALPVFGRTLGAASTGDLAAADAGLARLAELRDRSAELPIAYDWGTQVEVLRLSAEAWTENARGNTDDALRLARAAAELEDGTDKNPVTPGAVLPARELYGDLLLLHGRHEGALAAYEATLAGSPNRLRSLYGAGYAAELGGDHERARKHFSLLLELAGSSNWPEVQHARDYLET